MIGRRGRREGWRGGRGREGGERGRVRQLDGRYHIGPWLGHGFM